jgi:hypothetical protein
LNDHPRELLEHDWLYPLAGRPDETPAGHHNLAWEISGDRRFLTRYGDAEALIRELADNDHDIIISSEDFECSAQHADRFARFITTIQELGVRVSLIVYLRNQIDYAESLYITLIDQGLGQTFSAFCEEILETGKVCWREWTFPFRYDDFIAHLASFPNVEVIVRSYDAPVLGSPILDFFSIVARGRQLLTREELPHKNRRRALALIVRRYLSNQTECQLNDAEIGATIAFLDRYVASCPTMSLTTQIQFSEAFDKSNQVTCEQFGVAPFRRMERKQLRATAAPSLDDIFGPDLRAMALRA